MWWRSGQRITYAPPPSEHTLHGSPLQSLGTVPNAKSLSSAHRRENTHKATSAGSMGSPSGSALMRAAMPDAHDIGNCPAHRHAGTASRSRLQEGEMKKSYATIGARG